MLPDFRFAIGALLATSLLAVTGVGLFTSVRLSHQLKMGPLESSRSLAFDDRADWNQLYDPDSLRRFVGLAPRNGDLESVAMPAPAVAADAVPDLTLEQADEPPVIAAVTTRSPSAPTAAPPGADHAASDVAAHGEPAPPVDTPRTAIPAERPAEPSPTPAPDTARVVNDTLHSVMIAVTRMPIAHIGETVAPPELHVPEARSAPNVTADPTRAVEAAGESLSFAATPAPVEERVTGHERSPAAAAEVEPAPAAARSTDEELPTASLPAAQPLPPRKPAASAAPPAKRAVRAKPRGRAVLRPRVAASTQYYESDFAQNRQSYQEPAIPPQRNAPRKPAQRQTARPP